MREQGDRGLSPFSPTKIGGYMQVHVLTEFIMMEYVGRPHIEESVVGVTSDLSVADAHTAKAFGNGYKSFELVEESKAVQSLKSALDRLNVSF